MARRPVCKHLSVERGVLRGRRDERVLCARLDVLAFRHGWLRKSRIKEERGKI